MSRPIPDSRLRDITKLNDDDIKPRESKTALDIVIDSIRNKSSKDLVLGTLSGWIAGVTVVKVGKVAAFGLGGGILLLHFATESGYINVNWDRIKEASRESQAWLDRAVVFVKRNSCFSVGFLGGFFFGVASMNFARPSTPLDHERPPPQEPPTVLKPKPIEPFKATDKSLFLEKPTFLPPRPVSHSPKISPSSIPNPSPSITTAKMDQLYPNYGGYLYNIPGYSAFQPLSYGPSIPPLYQEPKISEPIKPDFVPFPTIAPKEVEEPIKPPEEPDPKIDEPKPQTDFEENFATEVIPPAAPEPEKVQPKGASKLSITSLIQGSGATVTIPSQYAVKDIERVKKKPGERFSLKTSIPISKIDMKCVNNPPEPVYQNDSPKITNNTSIQKAELNPRVEIQSNIVIKPASPEPEVTAESKNQTLPAVQPPVSNSISTLINAAEAISKNENQFWKAEQKMDVATETSEPAVASSHAPNTSLPQPKPVFNPINLDTSKVTFSNKAEGSIQTPYSEQKNQIVFIQNKQNPSNPKMLVTIQQQNPQVLLQRTTFEPKNLQAPSRLSSQSKKCKEEANEAPSKVVALKRLHQENCDENDFENLITENQIYGNKIVVKEKSQGTQQEQDLKNNNKVSEKPVQGETKNVVLQPNFLYLSNVQFPGNLMMIKNSGKINQNTEATKVIVTTSENKVVSEEDTVTTATESTTTMKPPRTVTVSKELHVLKSSNTVLQTLSNKSNKPDLVLQTNQKVIMSPQIVYQVPMIVDAESKTNQQIINPKFISQKVEYPKSSEQTKTNDKVFIACPYQMDTKLQPKIVITNIRPKIPKADEISSLDIYEKRRRNRRLKYLTNRDNKESKLESKKSDKVETLKNIITPEKMEVEICKEFVKTKVVSHEATEDSDSDYGEGELEEYNSIINEFGNITREDKRKQAEFLAGFRLATHNAYKEKAMELEERTLRTDAIAAAYVAAGRLDRLTHEVHSQKYSEHGHKVDSNRCFEKEDAPALHKKHVFLSHLRLAHVTPQYKEDYERSWQVILKERKRRNGEIIDNVGEIEKKTNSFATPTFDPNSTLQLLTEIQKCVHETNSFIKKRLDTFSDENSNKYSIKALAEKNFSDFDRLSKMADKSLKLFSGQNTRKRDLNPGFDSENIQKAVKYEPQVKNYPKINIPCYNKVVSVKTSPVAKTIEAPAEDNVEEREKLQQVRPHVESKEFSCQVSESGPWPGVEALIKSYREYEAGRKRELVELQKRNTSLRVEGAMITRAASRDSDRARALLAERHLLAKEEAGLRRSIHKLCAAVRAIRNY